MKVAIMQPYFLPYQGYWQLFSEADVFVLFDVVKFQKRSWMSRNRVLHSDPSKEFNYIKMPCIADSQTMISDVSVSLGADWLGHIEGVLSVYKRMKAPNYERVYALFEKWANSNRSGFTDVIQLIVEDLLPVIGVGCDVLQASSLGLDFSDIRGPGDWALQITKALGGDEYVNPCGGVDIFDALDYQRNGVDIKFLKPHLEPYVQGRRANFTEGLSIIDMLMFCSLDDVGNRIEQSYSLVDPQELKEI